MDFGFAFNTDLKFFFRVVKKPIDVRICLYLIYFGRAEMRMKGEHWRSAPESSQDHDAQTRLTVADRAEHGKMKRMPSLQSAEIEIFPDFFQNFAV
jgi:hypothetical protein